MLGSPLSRRPIGAVVQPTPASDAASVPAERKAEIRNATRKPPTACSTYWSTRRLATTLGVSHMLVARVWSKHRLQPHRLGAKRTPGDRDLVTETDEHLRSERRVPTEDRGIQPYREAGHEMFELTTLSLPLNRWDITT